MNKYSVILLLTCVLAACNVDDELSAISSNAASELVWVELQFNVPNTSSSTSYYYYAQISEAIYTLISNNELNTGFILLNKVIYWDEGRYHEYRDTAYTGELVFRVENIVKIAKLTRAPTNDAEIQAEAEVDAAAVAAPQESD